MKHLKLYIADAIKKLEKSIVATPTKEQLENFVNANKGSSDYLLMQMAIQRGYKIALEEIKETIKELEDKGA